MSNQESFMVKKPLSPISSPHEFSMRQRRGSPSTMSTQAKAGNSRCLTGLSMPCLIAGGFVAS